MMPPHSYGTQTIYSTHTAAAMTPEEVQLQAKLMPWVERLRGNKLPDDQRERLEEELEGAVKEIFEAKHQRQQEHLERLKKEVAETEKLLKEREAHKDEIVSRRVKELLGSPDPLSWDADVTRGPYRSGTVVSGYYDTAVPGQPFPVVRPLPGQSVPAVIGPSAAPQPSSQPPQQQRGRGQPRSPEHDEARPQPPTPPSPPAPPRDPNATRGPEEREPPKPE